MSQPVSLRPPIVMMVGMGRTGSTTIYHHLLQHPWAAMPFRKETQYFSANYGRGVDWYLDLFRHARPGQVGFDISPNYSLDDRALGRILEFDRHAKVFMAVREPVSWILSMYRQLAGTDRRIPPFPEFVRGYDRPNYAAPRICFDEGLVTRAIDRYRAAFGDNLLIYDFDLFRREPLRVCQAIEVFADLPRHFREENFSNVTLNASNRRHNRNLYAFLNSERVIDALRRVMPSRALRAMRQQYYLAVRRGKPSDPAAFHPKANVELAETLFGEERTAVRKFFSVHPMQLGSGTPFRF